MIISYPNVLADILEGTLPFSVKALPTIWTNSTSAVATRTGTAMPDSKALIPAEYLQPRSKKMRTFKICELQCNLANLLRKRNCLAVQIKPMIMLVRLLADLCVIPIAGNVQSSRARHIVICRKMLLIVAMVAVIRGRECQNYRKIDLNQTVNYSHVSSCFFKIVNLVSSMYNCDMSFIFTCC